MPDSDFLSTSCIAQQFDGGKEDEIGRTGRRKCKKEDDGVDDDDEEEEEEEEIDEDTAVRRKLL